jgi:pyruvate/2-oxoglutarate dehydrogenase complex dihydrolipoamide dehydrogenase (E3) component
MFHLVDKIVGRSRDVSDKNAGGMNFLFKKNKVDYVRGEAALEEAGAVTVKMTDGSVQNDHRRSSWQRVVCHGRCQGSRSTKP